VRLVHLIDSLRKSIQDAIREAGFEPQLRNQQYGYRELAELMEEQVIDY
jgi:cyclic dehypoxanthinyl futalosine synthase